jgi:hypothetical protein
MANLLTRDLFIQMVVTGRRLILCAACAATLVACGGGQSGPAAIEGSVSPAGADTTDGPSIALNPPGTVGPGNRIGLTWQASSNLTSYTVFVQRVADQAFEAVDAVVAGQSAQFSRGAAYRLDFPTARVRVRGCIDANQCVDSNEQPLLDALLGGLRAARPRPSARASRGCAQRRWHAGGPRQPPMRVHAVFARLSSTNGAWTAGDAEQNSPSPPQLRGSTPCRTR